MVFSSLIFVYLFLPVNLLCYAAFSDIRKKNICVLIFSLMFYAWMSPKYLILLVIQAGVNYFGARQIERFRGKTQAMWVLIADLCVTLGMLGYFKYLGLICQGINALSHLTGGNAFQTLPEIILPAGISFYTFQLISYVVDVYKGELEADKSFTNVLVYTSLFHQCIAGPIVRYQDIAKDLQERKTDIDSMNEGISRFCVGLAKKTLLANSCASILDSVLPETLVEGHVTILAAWMGGLLYMLQIYLDFSAYSDMAIGLGKMTGFHYRENFRYPYMAVSVTDFWRRWHISLSTFFRDYVYIPLGGNRKGIIRQLLNMLIVWALTGLWHGAAVNFILWGLYYFAFLAIEKLVLLKIFKHLPMFLYQTITRVYTLLVVFFGWILFRFTDFSQMMIVLRSLFGKCGNTFTNVEINTILMNNAVLLLVCVIAVTPLMKKLAFYMKKKAVSGKMGALYLYNALNIIVPVILLALSTLALIGNSYNPFIYFRF